jgi:hypothetical protein
MRLTIVIPDKTVCKDSFCILNLSWEGTPITVHALQWYEDHGEIEFNNGDPNQKITELSDWALNAVAAWDAVYVPPVPPVPPTPAETNKFTASGLLYQTDWTTISDVSDPTKSNPYLTNVQDFLNFRNTVRAVAINPPETPFDFPPIPKAQWSGS